MKSIKKIFKVFVVAFVMIVFSLFAFQNDQRVALSFLEHQTPPFPLFIIVIGCFLCGLLVAAFLSLTEILYMSRRFRKQEKQIRDLNKQLTAIKQQPLLDDFSVQSDETTEEADKEKAVAADNQIYS